ncbi:hypothetical protein [Aeoliella mucimassa]|uniref:hypothetical protein n=1 Tax=Aeoliella mucimassa TaxID=2527972 RepID=UPI00119FC3C2|nr:hypothetical protein [Aeoliella mucimassa]
MQIEVAGFAADLHDQLLFSHISSASYDNLAQLAGTLEFVFADELVVQAGDQIEFLRSNVDTRIARITGQFDAIVGLPELEDGLVWRMLYEPTTVSALVTYAGDFNADGLVDLADYTLWRDQLGTTNLSPYTGSDSDGNRTVDQQDYLIWREQFGLHLAPPPESVAIPEPASAVMLLLGLLAMSRCGGRMR